MSIADGVDTKNTKSTEGESLSRSMSILGTLFLTLSAITPASSVFIIIPGIIQTSGSGAFLSMVAAAVIGVCMAFVYAELSSAYPLSGGEYAIIGRVLGPAPGFIVLGLMLVVNILIPAVIALGLSTYIDAIIPIFSPIPTALVSVAIATFICILNIRTNAAITGIFLAIEIGSLLVLMALGFFHVVRPISDLIAHPVVLKHATLSVAPVFLITMGVSIAIFAYNGYGSAVYFGEETQDAHRNIARTTLIALVITVACELLPLTAVLMSVPDMKKFLGSSDMLGYFMTIRGGRGLDIVVSLGVAFAIFNATIAILLIAARQVYSTARDNVWNEWVNTKFRKVHPTLQSPWIATLFIGVLVALACFISENTLFVLTGTELVVVYSALCVAVIVGRFRKGGLGSKYRMPLFPLAPLLALASMLYVIYANWLDPTIGRPSLFATVGIAVLSIIYYVLVLRRRGDWVLQGPSE